jgi:hypothetical protein
MAIGNIANKETGSSVRTKLNNIIDLVNATIDASGNVTAADLTATGTVNFTGATVSNLGSVEGGTIDGVVIGGSVAAAMTCTTFTSTGIDDNATGERLQLSDSNLILGTLGAGFDIFRAGTDKSLGLSGGSSASTGASMILFGEAHASTPNDIRFRSGAGVELQYDDSASLWDFQLNQIVLDQGTADNGFINFQATINSDAVSAISSLTTSGATTHHLQVEINGTTFWIAGSTTDPS